MDITGMFGKYVKMALIGGPPLLLNFILFGLNNKYKVTVRYFDQIPNEEKKILNSALAKYTIVVTIILVILLLV